MIDIGAWWGPKQVTKDARAETMRTFRRDAPIHFYEGLNGTGKSLWMVHDTLPDLDAGIPVLSTVRLNDFRNLRPCEDLGCPCDKTEDTRHPHAHPAYRRWTTWGQLLDLVRLKRPCAVLADEVTGIADATEGASLPAQVKVFLPQLRRADGLFRLTGISWSKAHKSVRQMTWAVTRCESDWPITGYHDDGTERLYRPRRLTVARTYDAKNLSSDNPTEAAYKDLRPTARQALWIPASIAATAYNTFEGVDVIGTVDETGRCAYCGGHRAAVPCVCEDYVQRRATASARTDRKARSAEDRPQRRGGTSQPVDLPDPATGVVPALTAAALVDSCT